MSLEGRVFVEKPYLYEDIFLKESSTPTASKSRSNSANRLNNSSHRMNSISNSEILNENSIPSFGHPMVKSRMNSRQKSREGNINSTSVINNNSSNPLATREIKSKFIDNSHIDLKKSIKDEEKQKKIMYSIQKKERDEIKLNNLLNTIDDSTVLLNAIDKELKMKEESKHNKIRRQYEDWNNNVYGKIQEKIVNDINQKSSKEVNQNYNKNYNKFLEITNKKPAIFRDIIIESEYDPLEPNRNVIKARTGWLNDPAKISQQKQIKENTMLENASNLKNIIENNKSKTREVLDTKQWAAGQIEATPYGSFTKMMNTKKNLTELHLKLSTSSVKFDDFNFPRDHESIDKEMPKGKRIFHHSVTSIPSRVFTHLPPENQEHLDKLNIPKHLR